MVETKTKLVLKFKMCFLSKFDKNLTKVLAYYGKEWICDLLRVLTSLFVPKFLQLYSNLKFYFCVALKLEIIIDRYLKKDILITLLFSFT